MSSKQSVAFLIDLILLTSDQVEGRKNNNFGLDLIRVQENSSTGRFTLSDLSGQVSLVLRF